MIHEKGSAVIWVLIALTLFAAIGIAMMEGSRTATTMLTDEQAKAYAQQIIAYGNDVKQAVKRLQLRGCDRTKISFDNTVVAGYTNANAPANGNCDVFNQSGGGLSYQPINEALVEDNTGAKGYKETYFTDGAQIVDVGTNGASGSELLMIVPYLKREVCLALNKQLGINIIPVDQGIFVNNADYDTKKFQGLWLTPTYGLGDDSGLTDNAVIKEKYSLCVQASTHPVAQTYHYYNVLITR